MAELDPVEKFEDFFKSFRTVKDKTPYRDRIQSMVANGEISLQIDFEDIIKFDPQLAKKIQEKPVMYLNSADEAIKNVMKIIDEEYAEEVPHFFARLFNLPTTIPLRGIRSKHIGKYIQVSGILTRASEIKPQLRIGVFKCGRCDEEIEVIQEGTKLIEPEVCLNPECKRSGPFKMVAEKSVFRDWQKIGVQEKPEELPAGQLPRSVSAIIIDDMVDKARPGDRVHLSGVLHSYPETGVGRGKSTIFNSIIEANNIVQFEQVTRGVTISPEDEVEIKKQAKEPFIVQNIISSIAPSIHGNEEIKEAVALLLFGGVRKQTLEGTNIRGEPNILLVGDPGVGKSQILKYITELAPRALYTSGRGSTAAGLTAAVMKDTETGGMTLEAGALVLSDLGTACIDEFDKMRKEDASAIHEAMEQQTVSIAKAGIVATLNARTSILAAANPAFGRYNTYKTPAQNLTLPVTVLSRFDLIFIMTDAPDEKLDRQLSSFILNIHRDGGPPTEPPFASDFLRKYVAYAKKNAKPKLTEKASEKIQEFYLQMRQMSQDPDAAIAITPRQLESLIRLSEARAKMALKPEVEAEDAEAVIKLMEFSLKRVAFDEATGTFDIGRITIGTPKSQLDKMQKVLETVVDLMSDDKNGAPIEKILEKTSEMNIDPAETRRVLRQYMEDGTLYSPKGGFYRKA